MAQILLIDDDAISRDALGNILRTGGHHVDPASDGFEAILCLREKGYDTILVDYQLPDMDGHVLARLLLETAVANKRKPILVAMTGHGDSLAPRNGADRLFHSILSKRIAPQQLLAHIASLSDTGDMKVPRDVAVRNFIANPNAASAKAAAGEIWCVNGLPGHPKAAVTGVLSLQEERAVVLCFDVVNEDQADLVLALMRTSLRDTHGRIGERGSLLPLISLDSGDGHCDAVFTVGDKASWRNVAKKVMDFSKRRTRCDRFRQWALTPNGKLLAYLYVTERPVQSIPPLGEESALSEEFAGVQEWARGLHRIGMLDLRDDCYQLTAAARQLIESGRQDPLETQQLQALLPQRSTPVLAPDMPIIAHTFDDANVLRVPFAERRSQPSRLPARAKPNINQLARSNAAPRSAFDRSVFDGLSSTVGQAEVQRLCRSLLDKLQSANFDHDSYVRAPSKCRALAHQLVCVSGMLGFSNLSRLCQELATHQGNVADRSRVLSELGREREASVATIVRLQEVAA